MDSTPEERADSIAFATDAGEVLNISADAKFTLTPLGKMSMVVGDDVHEGQFSTSLGIPLFDGGELDKPTPLVYRAATWTEEDEANATECGIFKVRILPASEES